MSLLTKISIFILFFLSFNLVGQQVDSIIIKQDKNEHTFVPNPRKSLILSFILPGSGQIYNRKYWKAPIVYGGFAGIGYWIYFNNDGYQFYKKEYHKRLDENWMPEYTPIIPQTISTTAIKERRNDYRKKLERSYFAMAGYYALVAIEAYVDAHLQHFDITDDLTIHIKPKGILDPISQSITPGIGVALNFN